MQEVQPQIFPILAELLKSGGLVLLTLGFILAAIGIVALIQPKRTPSTILAFLSLLPSVLGLVAVYSAAIDLHQLYGLQSSPKPSHIGEIASRALSYGFCGFLGTIVPMAFAILALLRAQKSFGVSDAVIGTASPQP